MKLPKNVLFTSLLMLCLLPLAQAAELPNVLLITGKAPDSVSNRYPNWEHEFYNEEIVKALEGLVDITISEDLTLLNDKHLARYDLIMNNSLFRAPNQQQLAAFYRFIEGGKSYLALHSGLATFLNSERYSEMIGGHFLGWDNRKSLQVHTFDAWYGYDYNDQTQHPITRSLPNFLIDDELFLMHTNTDALEVIARAEHHPVLWLRDWHKGKVMGLALGNGKKEARHPDYHRLLQNSVRWLVGYPIVETLPDGRFLRNAGEVKEFIHLQEISHHSQDAPMRYQLVANTNPELVKAQIDDRGHVRLTFASELVGTARITVQIQAANGLTTAGDFTLTVDQLANGNLAGYHGVSAHTSSNEFRKFTADPAYVLDENPATRWSSAYEDSSWIYLDLGESRRINRVRLLWEGAYGQRYQIQVSDDADTWTSVYRESKSDGGEDDIRFAAVEGRYIRLYGEQRATPWGYSLYEFEVFGD